MWVHIITKPWSIPCAQPVPHVDNSGLSPTINSIYAKTYGVYRPYSNVTNFESTYVTKHCMQNSKLIKYKICIILYNHWLSGRCIFCFADLLKSYRCFLEFSKTKFTPPRQSIIIIDQKRTEQKFIDLGG